MTTWTFRDAEVPPFGYRVGALAQRDMELRHLEMADRHLAEGAERIGRQEEMVATLDRGGHDTKEAVKLLELLRGVQEQGVVHRQSILQALNEPESGSMAG